MSLVLAFTVPAPRKYPSVNHLGRDGFRGGKKSPEYHELFDAVKRAAEAEMLRVGWECADYLVDASLTVYFDSGRQADAGNTGKCELDAMTAAGVWRDDRLARPLRLDTEHDPSGPSRIVIVARRKFPPYIQQASSLVVKARQIAAKKNSAAPSPVLQPQKVMYVNGVPVPYDDRAKAEILKRMSR